MRRRNRIWIRLSAGLGKGLWLKVDPESEEGYVRGIAEPGVQGILSKHLKRGDCFYDVGAHIGFYSMIAAQLVGESGLVVAFEPDPCNVKLLQDNCSRNNLTHVLISQAAVWGHCGRVLFKRGRDQSRMTGRVVAGGNYLPRQTVLWRTALALDTLAASCSPPTFVKIDVEGAELRVLEGAQTTLRRSKPTLLVEIHSRADIPAVLDFLSPLGYLHRTISTQPRKSLVYFECQIQRKALQANTSDSRARLPKRTCQHVRPG